MDQNNRNFVLALAISAMIMLVWQVFLVGPEKAKTPDQVAIEQAVQQAQTPAQGPQPGSVPQPGAVPPAGGPQGAPNAVAAGQSREAALGDQKTRVVIDTPSLSGSVSLKGGRIDDLTLLKFKQTVAPDSPKVVLLSPSGSPEPYYTQFGWRPVAIGDNVKLPGDDTVWKSESDGPLTAERPLKLVYNNGEGLIFRRTIALDENYMFTVTDEVENHTKSAVALYPYNLISRHGTPVVAGLYFMHEGLFGVTDKLHEVKYSELAGEKNAYVQQAFEDKGGWLGITDKYWATAIIPDQNAQYSAYLQYYPPSGAAARESFQAAYTYPPQTIAAGAKGTSTSMIFAGAKQVAIVDAYDAKYGIKSFEKMIDWGWFPFITKPLFHALDYFYHLFGNFGLSILIVTVLVKLLFFPLANKSYASMSKMKKLQPEMERIKERFGDDRMKQQQAIMELYKKEKINPMAGCLPVIIQIPVFFALYKVIYVSIEMRQAPFIGWIQDLSAQDPTSIFNLFGLIPWAPPAYLMVGAWPLIMGVTMWVQMKLNPAATDPMQQRIFNWMPVMFTYMLYSFPAGLVIYWTWNNTLSVFQQWVIMRRNGVEVNLFENMGLPRKIWSAVRRGGPAE